MKYKTKVNYKDNGWFPVVLEILDDENYGSDEVFNREYKKLLNSLWDGNPTEENKRTFENNYKDFYKRVNNFFHKDILEKLSDTRLLTLGKVKKEEYDMLEEIIIKKYSIYKYYKDYNKIENKLPYIFKNDFYLNEVTIKNILEDYEILEEEMNFVNGTCLADEIYLENDTYELHLLINVKEGSGCKLGYFTIRAKNIIIK
jgi:hypothetical protein